MKRTIAAAMAVTMIAALAGATSSVRAEDRVSVSIMAAVNYLKRVHGNTSASQYDGEGENETGNYQEGPAALAGLALAEAGVPLNDPAMVNIAARIRNAAVKQQNTYQLGLNIMFLDKLGTPLDTELIQSMAIRLLNGQTARGGWTYKCPGVDEKEQTRLRDLVANAKPPAKESSQVGLEIDSRPQLTPGNLDVIKNRRLIAVGPRLGTTDDNSNTQFALLGLWAARRHGVPVDDALSALEKRMNAAQDRTGGWCYVVGGAPLPTPPMTCVGLLALAVSSGNNTERVLRSGSTRVNPDGTVTKKDPSDKPPPKIVSPLENPRVRAGLAFLSYFIVAPKPKGEGNGSVAPSLPGAGQGQGAIGEWMSDLYFLWSLERVCMVFELKRIGDKDWYAIGANYLIGSQAQDGSWRSKYIPEIETSFGLMFMCRSNLVKDLSRILKAGPGAVPKIPAAKPGGGSTTSTNTAANSEVAELVKSLVEAKGAKQAELLEKFKATKGTVYTSALAQAIPKLPSDMQKPGRKALADRIWGFRTEVVQAYLKEDDAELRAAAAIAAAMRDDRSLIPDIIALLGDSSELVWREARRALKTFSDGKDFGPPPGATDDEKKMAIAQWTAWYKQQK